jgi:hypothetical protein
MPDLGDITAAYLNDFGGKTFVAGGISGLGVLRGQSTYVSGGEELYFEQTILGRYSELGGLSYGAQILFDGVNYEVIHDPLPSSDSKFCRVPVKRIDPEEAREVIIWGGSAEPIEGPIYFGGGA